MEPVGRTVLETSLAALRGVVNNPAAGIHGPGSKSWEINREGVLFLGGGRAALLQIAHPFVGHGVDDHSATRTDPQGRFIRTFENVWAMVFGPLEEALESARRVHAIHAKVAGTIDENVGRFRAGTRYSAADPEALLWVYATLVDSAVVVYERMVRALTAQEKEQYYRESQRFACLFGIPETSIPPDWNAFVAYLADMYRTDTIHVGSRAREIARFLLSPPHVVLTPAANWYRAVTARLLPPAIRMQFGLRYGRVERTMVESSLPVLRQILRALPAQLRYLPVYRRALARVADGRAA